MRAQRGVASGLVVFFAVLSLAACGGGGSDGGASGGGGNDDGGNNTPSSHAVGGTVSGLSGTVTLQNNGGDTISVAADGSFRFTVPLPVGQSYQVSVASQPVNQHCAVTAGSGVMGPAEISNVAINCTTTRFTVRGTLSGLIGSVVLRNNGSDDLTLTANGDFVFPTALVEGSPYQVTVLSQPTNQQCTVTSGSGSIGSADISGVAVACTSLSRLGGTISGLTGIIILQNNAADDLITATNGSFTFATPVMAGATYQVTVRSQPPRSQCTVTSGSGTMDSTDVTNIIVACAPTFTVGGSISGLVGPVVLSNGTDQLTIDSNGSFTFGTPLLSGASYAVSFVSTSDPAQRCEVSSGTGTIHGDNVTTVRVACTTRPARYSPESYASFTSLNGTSNLEGTWILLAEGTQSRGYQIAGINPRQDYQLWSRTTVRIRRDPLDPAQYFVLTCGPGGSRNTRTTPLAGSFSVPYYSSSTSIWSSYGVTIVDATTMRRASVSRAYAYSGNSDGLIMGWNLSWVLKRISDDPFANTATVRDNLSGQTAAATCIHEVEGTYAATEHDGRVETSRVEGLFFWTDAYESSPTQLFNDTHSYAPRFSLKDEIGYRTWYSTSGSPPVYLSADVDQISTLRSFSGTSSSHSVQAESADGLEVADDTLDISP